MTFKYLASPYSHENGAVEHARYMDAKAHAIHYTLEEKDFAVFSPINYSHPIHVRMKDMKMTPISYQSWIDWDLSILEQADALWVLKLPGWDVSRGVMIEMTYANTMAIPIVYKEPEVMFHNGTLVPWTDERYKHVG
jgi:hypothetical protein